MSEKKNKATEEVQKEQESKEHASNKKDINKDAVKDDAADKNNKGKNKEKKDKSAEKIKELEEMILKKDDQFLRLQAEFDNFRRRTLKEKMELTKSAGESILVNVLPVMDDFERAIQSMNEASSAEAVREGLELIYKRFSDFLQQNGVKPIEAIEKDFDTDLHEAITKIPAPKKELKGKIVDVVQKGYVLNEKVIRYAKVVIGE